MLEMLTASADAIQDRRALSPVGISKVAFGRESPICGSSHLRSAEAPGCAARRRIISGSKIRRTHCSGAYSRAHLAYPRHLRRLANPTAKLTTPSPTSKYEYSAKVRRALGPRPHARGKCERSLRRAPVPRRPAQRTTKTCRRGGFGGNLRPLSPRASRASTCSEDVATPEESPKRSARCTRSAPIASVRSSACCTACRRVTGSQDQTPRSLWQRSRTSTRKAADFQTVRMASSTVRANCRPRWPRELCPPRALLCRDQRTHDGSGPARA